MNFVSVASHGHGDRAPPPPPPPYSQTYSVAVRCVTGLTRGRSSWCATSASPVRLLREAVAAAAETLSLLETAVKGAAIETRWAPDRR